MENPSEQLLTDDTPPEAISPPLEDQVDVAGGDDNASPDTPDPVQNELDAIIAQAQRVHELIDAVDLEKVAQHDHVELDKLGNVSNALSNMANGKQVDVVEGVDEVTTPADRDQTRKAQLLEALIASGWSESVGRVLCAKNGVTSSQPVDVIPHFKGLPAYDLCLKPKTGDEDGAYGLFVTRHAILAASIAEPATTHLWHINQTVVFNDTADVVSALNELDGSNL